MNPSHDINSYRTHVRPIDLILVVLKKYQSDMCSQKRKIRPAARRLARSQAKLCSRGLQIKNDVISLL